MVILKGSYVNVELKNLMEQSVQKAYFAVGDRKLPRFMGGSTRPRMEICETSGLLIKMVPRLHQSNGYIKRKLRVWRGQKSNSVVGAETVLSSAGPQTTPFHGGQYRAEKGKMRNFGPTNQNGDHLSSLSSMRLRHETLCGISPYSPHNRDNPLST